MKDVSELYAIYNPNRGDHSELKKLNADYFGVETGENNNDVVAFRKRHLRVVK